MNVHDSERIAGILKREGYSFTDNPEKADIVLFNTCSVRQKAEQKFYSQLGRAGKLKKKRPDLKIAVGGCIAQQEGERLLKRVSTVDFSFGPQNISRLSGFLNSDEHLSATEENRDLNLTDIPVKRNESIKAWINIMYGCDNFCSYCVVPYTRGRERSRPLGNIVAEITDVVRTGCKEVTLLGQNVNSYNGECSFPELLVLINKIEGLERIRFITSHPSDFTDELISVISELDKVCEHIHLPLQSGSTRILGLMNRKYTYDEYRDKIIRLRKSAPDISITSDIITGFPSETVEDHNDTVNALKEIDFDGIFAFKYSKRPYTKASMMDSQIPDEIKSERLNEILEVQESITEKKNTVLEGKTLEILIEGLSENGSRKWTGRTRTNKIVNFFPEKNIKKGTFIYVKIIKGHKHSLEGEIVNE